jgi:hypothetical protein
MMPRTRMRAMCTLKVVDRDDRSMTRIDRELLIFHRLNTVDQVNAAVLRSTSKLCFVCARPRHIS